MNRNLIFYVLVVVVFGSLLWFVFNQGSRLNVIPSTQTIPGEAQESASLENQEVASTDQAGAVVVFIRSLFENLEHPLSLLLIQIVVIVLLSRFLALLVSKIGQPMVIGEIIADK